MIKRGFESFWSLFRSYFCSAVLLRFLIIGVTVTPALAGADAARDYADGLGRGINLGNALEAHIEGQWGVTLQEEYFAIIAKAGFDSVRIPIRWSAHAMEEAPYTIDEEFFARVDWAVEQAVKNDLYVVVNIHHYDELYADPAAHRERYLALWKQIAAHYADQPKSVSFELLNEPCKQFTAEGWNDLLNACIPVIRESNPDRILIVGGILYNNIEALKDLKLPEDDRNIIGTFHYYNPFMFTHQGAGWASKWADKWIGTVWTGSEAEQAAVKRDFQKALDWSKETGYPVYMGEFGAYSKADMKSRVAWTAFVASYAMENDIPFAYWEFCAGFGAYDPEAKEWRQGLLEGLVPPAAPSEESATEN